MTARANESKEEQERGLTLFWAHDLGAQIDFIEATRS